MLIFIGSQLNLKMMETDSQLKRQIRSPRDNEEIIEKDIATGIETATERQRQSERERREIEKGREREEEREGE